MKRLFLMLSVALAAVACDYFGASKAIPLAEAQERQGWTNFSGVSQMESNFFNFTLPALRGNVESVKICCNNGYYENDYLLFQFNQRGDVLEWGYYSGGYALDKYVYSYNSQGLLESERSLGIFEGYTKHKYNNKNQRTQTIRYNSNNTVASKESYAYDQAGNMIKSGNLTYGYDPNGNKIFCKSRGVICATWVYDAQGRLIESTGDDDYHFFKDVYTYDSSGRISKKDEYFKEDVAEPYTYSHTSKYVYDRLGNLVEQRIIYADGGDEDKIIYRYDSQGNVVAKGDYIFEISYRK